ncbi:hypothetical protein [Shewanella holmiensis]|uniref:Uncharacterized protein n=1 Tax=Shewanella holmiensis TaxID=2952222 RepID=A0A9X2WLW8_9GAMM|nr:hypothetical protein [Shewanella holmiensis]MCT7941560.1 hypothetical protein [Shewanella holmiensis]
MKNLLITILLSLAIVPSALSAASLYEKVTDEQYLKLEFLPLCTSEGQTIFQITNVSGQKLLVDPAFMEVDKYDAHRFGVDLVNLTISDSYPKMTSKANAGGQGDWYPMEAGEVIQHKIDFREYAISPLDTSAQYMPAFNGMPIRMITTLEGKKVTMFKGVFDTTFSSQFGPGCWK